MILLRRGLAVVSQPGFLADRGDDFVRDLPARDHDDLYRCRSLTSAGVALALSSDAPYGPLDPWIVLAAATNRRTLGGRVVGPAEILSPAEALDCYLAPVHRPGTAARTIKVGGIADLVLLDVPLDEALRAPGPGTPRVRMTIIHGAVVHER